jgi:diguanylate cyclase (GGDEF)-like protein
MPTAEDPATEIQRLGETLTDTVWSSAIVVAALALGTTILRDLKFGGVTWRTGVIGAICFTAMIVAPFHRRLPNAARTSLPIVLVFLGASSSLERSGLEGPGVCYLVFVNVLAALTLGRRWFVLTFLATGCVVTLAAAGYVTHHIQSHLSRDYPASAEAWMMAGTGLASIGWIVYRGLIIYHESLLGLSAKVASQRDEMASFANVDGLTGLPTRRLAWDRLGVKCRQAVRSGEPFAVLYIDLDGFKAINDHYGHQTGDHVLATIGRRLMSAVRHGDTAARLGGDEFLVLLDGPIDAEAAALVASKLTEAIGRPIDLEGSAMRVGASIGIALFPQDGVTPETLLPHADRAMYAGKKTKAAPTQVDLFLHG